MGCDENVEWDCKAKSIDTGESSHCSGTIVNRFQASRGDQRSLGELLPDVYSLDKRLDKSGKPWLNLPCFAPSTNRL